MPREQSVAGVNLSHPDRVVFPGSAFTKADLARYYAELSERILPHLSGRPLTLIRAPDGADGDSFYQKRFPDNAAQGLRTIPIRESTGTGNYVIVEDVTGLISLVQWGVVEFHPWGARADNPEHPDRLIFDLDPGPEVTWENLIDAARQVRKRLTALNLQSFVRTTGGKGLHVVAPLMPTVSWDDLKTTAHRIATAMTNEQPDRFTDHSRSDHRQGRIFVDYLRNTRGATAVASYSTRFRPLGPVATPLRWDELTARIRANTYTVGNLQRRLGAMRTDPWEGFFELRQTLALPDGQ